MPCTACFRSLFNRFNHSTDNYNSIPPAANSSSHVNKTIEIAVKKIPLPKKKKTVRWNYIVTIIQIPPRIQYFEDGTAKDLWNRS